MLFWGKKSTLNENCANVQMCKTDFRLNGNHMEGVMGEGEGIMFIMVFIFYIIIYYYNNIL